MRQHYIPRWLLENFVDKTGKMYAFVKLNPSGGIFRTRPENLMAETNLYELQGVVEPDQGAIESEFANLEAKAKPIADKIICAVRNGECPHLDPGEKSTWDEFYARTFLRAKTINVRNEIYRDVEERTESLKVLAPSLPTINNPGFVKNTTHNAVREVSSAPFIPELLKTSAAGGLRIGRILEANRSLVIGSVAIAIVHHRRVRHAWLPLSHDVAVTPFNGVGNEELFDLADREIRAINEASYRGSHIVGAHSLQILCSLVKRYG